MAGIWKGRKGDSQGVRNAKGVQECGLVPKFPSPSILNPCHAGYKKDEHEHKAYAVEPQYDKSQLLGIINDFLRPTNNKIY